MPQIRAKDLQIPIKKKALIAAIKDPNLNAQFISFIYVCIYIYSVPLPK